MSFIYKRGGTRAHDFIISENSTSALIVQDYFCLEGLFHQLQDLCPPHDPPTT